MLRKLNICINPLQGVITEIKGDSSFYFKDNNQISINLENSEDEKYYVSVSGNVPGSGNYIAEAVKQDDGSYLISPENMNGFLLKIGKVNCNIHITNSEGEKITTLPFSFESKLAYDRDGSTVVAPTNIKDLNDFYAALDELKSIDDDKLQEAIKILEG